MEVCDIVQEAVIKTISKKKKCKKAKWLSGERKEDKLKAKEKRKDIHLIEQVQSIVRRDKKAFLNDQWK